MFKLNQAQTTDLLGSPESGMGYQLVEATLRDDKKKDGVVYNADLLVLNDERQLRILELRESYPRSLRFAQDAAGEVKALRVLAGPRLMALSEAEKKSVGATDGLAGKTKAGAAFKRFSAYANDNRVMADASLRPGTFATTEDDAKNVKTGTGANARYALPNPAPASCRYTIRPDKDTAIQSGIVQAANGQPGGGVEVIFTNGTQPKTVALPPDKIPDV
jgi:hypothetical protein